MFCMGHGMCEIKIKNNFEIKGILTLIPLLYGQWQNENMSTM